MALSRYTDLLNHHSISDAYLGPCHGDHSVTRNAQTSPSLNEASNSTAGTPSQPRSIIQHVLGWPAPGSNAWSILSSWCPGNVHGLRL